MQDYTVVISKTHVLGELPLKHFCIRYAKTGDTSALDMQKQVHIGCHSATALRYKSSTGG